ncbi:hypothetical protein A3Q56_01814 [Intoshia linei]|uniref:GPR180-like N-terminal domain-containing protein n=1 Tax=Intoshia linei TaxID=1819745 RepID=A0A177B858_9BILA|nr:hypothetical protein A3Q56_01814 [Intoshia linei]
MNYIAIFLLLFYCVAPRKFSSCILRGYVHTRDQIKFDIANVTLRANTHITWKISYPISLKHPYLLFYTEEMWAALRSINMNCWNSVDLAQPVTDNRLILSPQYTWSGCLQVIKAGRYYIECNGSKTLKFENNVQLPNRIYLGFAHCSSSIGLEITYLFKIASENLICTPPFTNHDENLFDTKNCNHELPPKFVITTSSNAKKRNANYLQCSYHGTINYTSSNWFGFMYNFTIKRGAVFNYSLYFPESFQSQSIVFYKTSDIIKISNQNNCWPKLGIISTTSVAEQTISLSAHDTINGCKLTLDSNKKSLVHCSGSRILPWDDKIHVALANCISDKGLMLDYKFHVDNVVDSKCSCGCKINTMVLAIFLITFAIFNV